jgi:hypothetical protein
MAHKAERGGVEQADGNGKCKTFLKKIKTRKERRRAKDNPECASAYKKYNGYQL